MSGPRRFVLGSVPNKVSHHAPCSLLIVDTSAGSVRVTGTLFDVRTEPGGVRLPHTLFGLALQACRCLGQIRPFSGGPPP